jgi:spore germination protein KA
MSLDIKSAQHGLERLLIDGRISHNDLKSFFKNHTDIVFWDEGFENISVFYCQGMIDTAQFNEYIKKVVNEVRNKSKRSLIKNEKREEPPLKVIKSINEMIEKLFSGTVIIYRDGDMSFWGMDISKVPQRTTEESSSDISIKGPKDAFTEEVETNVSLIRKRMKSIQLFHEAFTVGTLSQMKISVLYLDHKINKERIEELRKRISSIDTESIVSAGQLEQWLSDRTLSLFPLFDYTTRPDFVIESMLRGRFIIIVAGSPFALIGPTNLLELIKSPEDVHFPYHFVIFQRFIRIIGMFVAIFLPGLWVSISSVNISQLPFSLLATVVISREGIPFPTAIETLFILGLFELLREAGVRMPAAVGQTVSIVGGLIIGDAAIRAGLTSPILIVIVALTAVATYTLVNQSLTGTVSILRIYCIVVSSFLGVYGFFISMFSILIYISNLESFKLRYLAPLSDIDPKEILSAMFINPSKNRNFTWKALSRRSKS